MLSFVAIVDPVVVTFDEAEATVTPFTKSSLL
jgi:hypothetical protein